MAEVPDRGQHRMDEIFGEVLPAVTHDELTDAADGPSRGDGDPADEELRANRPPHHDRE
jgi:hypothetical protein